MILSDSFIIYIIIVFLFGICIGSFLNVCIYRIPENKSIATPGSFCPSCKTPIPFYYNIPILSYILLRGCCKFCKKTISIRYLLIECLTGIFAVLLLLKFGITLEMGYWFVFISTLITISFIDYDHQIIPDVISLPGIIIFASAFYFVPQMTVKDVIFGILIGGGSLTTVAMIYYFIRRQEGMGGGDIKLLAMIGAAIGVKGVLFTIFAGSLFGTIVGITEMVISRNSDLKLKIPFGPYLSLGAIGFIFFGEKIITWYFTFLTS